MADEVFEALVRAHGADLLRFARRFPRLALALSAAAVLAVVAAVLLAVQSGHRQQGVPPAGQPARDIAVPPAGYQWASYHGIEIAVPKIIQWVYVICYPPTASYVEFIVPNMAISCPGRPLTQSVPDPDSVSVTLAPVGTPLDGPVIGDRRPQQTRTLADPGVVVQVGAPTQAQVDVILGSIRRTPVDHLGCRERLTSTTPANPPASSLVETGPRSAVVCSYTRMSPDNRYWLVSSRQLDASDAALLATKFSGLPAVGGTSSASRQPPIDWIVFDYGSTTRTVTIEREVDPAYVSDGQRTLVANSAAADPPLPDI